MATASAPSGLAPDLAALRETPPGARYLRADLQVHTPLDPAFEPKRDLRTPEARRDVARDYLTEAKERGVELVGITEHNDVSWIDDLRWAAKQLGLHLLPGFEVESKEGVHVLCLFDPDRPVPDLEEVLVGLGLTSAQRKQRRLELRSTKPFDALLDFVQGSCDGICIAAHVETDKGLLTAIRGGARVDAWKTGGLMAIQTAKPPADIDSGNGRIIRGEDPIYARERLPACVLTSDARTFAAVGSKTTWIKMDTVGVEGLRQAFLDPESRISYADPRTRQQGGHLLAVGWDGDFLDGIRFPLNAQLNCLIGGKGTGKSTVLETIRYAFDLDYHTDETRDAGQTLLKHAFRSGSKVSVLIETDAPARKQYIVERTAPHAPIVRDRNGDPHPELDPRELLRPCVYGQKEIYGIAQNASARLELLDGFAANDLRDVVEMENALAKRADDSARHILTTQDRLAEAEERLAELPNLEAWRQRFREAGFEDLLRERRDLDREGRMFQTAREALEKSVADLRSLQAEATSLPAAMRSAEGEALPNADLIARAREVLSAIDEQRRGQLQQLQDGLSAAQHNLDEIHADWQTRRRARQDEFDAALRQLQERIPDVDPERYLDVERRIEQLTPLHGAREQLKQRLETLHRDRGKLIVDLDEARGGKHRVRAQAARSLNDALKGNVVVELDYQGERDGFLRRLIELKSGARQDALRRLVHHPKFSPSAFIAAWREHKVGERFELPTAQASAIERAIDDRTALALETLELADRVDVKLDVAVAGPPDLRTLDRLSPGQRSTAILLLVMHESRDPLLVDQPEDDLDNRFIYDDIVKRLREAKPQRQFLIATHNANIPVLGDAEQIVALDAEERGGTVSSYIRARGSIDDADVRDAAEHILEGGQEAFERRSRKYHR